MDLPETSPWVPFTTIHSPDVGDHVRNSVLKTNIGMSSDVFQLSQETYHRRDDMGGSMSGSLSGMSAVSNKPCLNRELVAKLRSMTETINMLSTENVALREENDQLLNVRDDMLPVATTSSTGEGKYYKV